MSSLWTPGGEIPVERNRPAADTDRAPDPEPVEDGPDRAQIEALQRQLLEAPAGDVIAQHLMAFYELAAMHLAQPEPRLADARLAIDAIEALLQGLEGRLGEAEAAIAQALPELKMAFVQASDRRSEAPTSDD